jgi:hypothetical protein
MCTKIKEIKKMQYTYVRVHSKCEPHEGPPECLALHDHGGWFRQKTNPGELKQWITMQRKIGNCPELPPRGNNLLTIGYVYPYPEMMNALQFLRSKGYRTYTEKCNYRGNPAHLIVVAESNVCLPQAIDFAKDMLTKINNW